MRKEKIIERLTLSEYFPSSAANDNGYGKCKFCDKDLVLLKWNDGEYSHEEPFGGSFSFGNSNPGDPGNLQYTINDYYHFKCLAKDLNPAL